MSRGSRPRGLVARCALAAGLFALCTAPGWALGDLIERWTGSAPLDWLVTGAGNALALRLLAPWGSYRPRDGWSGLIPVYGWYLTCVLCWRAALLPLRDWEPRADELWRARWLTGDLLGLWRADAAHPVRAARRPAAGRPTR
jgi:hypothetical protein